MSELESVHEDAGPNLRRRHLGRQMRQLRDASGKTLKEVAKWTNLLESTISKIEKGRHTTMPRNIRLLCQAYDVGSPQSDHLVKLAEQSNERGWWDFYSDELPDWFEQFVGLESDAEELWYYSPLVVDGLLQTPAYAAAFFEIEPGTSQPERAIELRRARQDRVNRDAHPTQLHVVLDEAAVRRMVGGVDVMREQLRYLVEAADKPNITIQVMPFSAGAHLGLQSPFRMLRFPEGFDMDAVFVENLQGAIWQERPGDLERYTKTFQHLRERALSPVETTKMLDSLAADL